MQDGVLLMFFCNYSRLWIFLSLVFCSHSVTFADNRVFSTAYGLGALRWVANDVEIRKAISITEAQLTEVRNYLRDKNSFDGDEASDEANGRAFLKKVLTIDQVNLIRMEVVKSKIGTPANLFSPSFLREFVGEEDAMRIYYDFAELHWKIINNSDKLRIAAIKKALPQNSQDILWKFVGTEFSIDENGGDLQQISSWVPPILQISQAPYLTMPSNRLELSSEQREQLSIKADEVQRKMAQGISFSRGELDREMDAILTLPQRFAVLQALNLLVLRSDLLILCNPDMAKLYGLRDEELSEAKSRLSESKKNIEEMEKAQVIQACNEVLAQKDVPLHVKTEIKQLVAGVWELSW
jgi:hypothetical protein